MKSRHKRKSAPVKSAPVKFQSIPQSELPQGRTGKHKNIVLELLADIDRLRPGQALKIPISELPDRKENIRSALNRATRQRGLELSTSSDADYLYVWVPEAKLK